LVAAVLVSTVYLDRLSRLGETAVTAGVEGARLGRILTEQLTGMERHASQYAVLRDPALLELYENRRARFETAAEDLRNAFADPELDAAVTRLLRRSRALTVAQPDGEAAEAPAFEELLNTA